MMEDIDTYDPDNTYLGDNSNIGGLFDTKKHFYRLISLLLSDLGLVFDIRSPSPWKVISGLRNQHVIAESDSTRLKVCLSIANEIRLKTYFANSGQKELFSPLLQISDTAEQSADDPFFREVDEDTLVRLLSTSADLLERCRAFGLKYVQQDEVDASVLRNHVSVPYSKPWLMTAYYFRLQKFSKALEYSNSISKDTPDYAQGANLRGVYYTFNRECKKAIECFETALKCSQNPSHILMFLINLVKCLSACSEFKKAKNMLEEAMKLHDEIYGEGSETIILSQLMLCLNDHFYALDDIPSAIETLQRVEEIQKRMTPCRDMDVIHLNLAMALSYSKLCQNRSLDYLNKALYLCHKIFGEHSINYELAELYLKAASVYTSCGRHSEAFSMLERSLKLTEALHGDTVNASKSKE